ncbi:MAG TPA: hypothetical protein VJY47_02910 [Candidatus Dojkabacteria bacterium]|nr:hypothetical protein [Candidatus Dojkabacteria bacterium]
MIIPTKEILINIVRQQGYPYDSVKGENLYLNLLPLTEGEWTGQEVKDFLMNLRERISPDLDVPEILRQLDIL